MMFKLDKRKISLILKIALPACLLYWVISKGNFNVENIKFGILNTKLCLSFLVLKLLQLIMATFRTNVFMQFRTGTPLKIQKIFTITWASLFINCLAPSILFGDVFRIKEFMKIDSSTNKDNSIYSSAYSKLFSVVSLFVISLISSLLLDPFPEKLRPLITITLTLAVMVLFGIVFRSILFKIIYNVFTGAYNLSANDFFVRRLDALKTYTINSINKKNIAIGLLTSFSIQVFNTISFLLIIYAINPTIDLDYIQLTSVIPIGIFIMMIPVSFSGLGVGHVAFSGLLSLFSVTNGSDVFSVYFALSYLFNLLGAIPYFFTIKGFSSDRQFN